MNETCPIGHLDQGPRQCPSRFTRTARDECSGGVGYGGFAADVEVKEGRWAVGRVRKVKKVR